jgi:hypothetical protein
MNCGHPSPLGCMRHTPPPTMWCSSNAAGDESLNPYHLTPLRCVSSHSSTLAATKVDRFDPKFSEVCFSCCRSSTKTLQQAQAGCSDGISSTATSRTVAGQVNQQKRVREMNTDAAERPHCNALLCYVVPCARRTSKSCLARADWCFRVMVTRPVGSSTELNLWASRECGEATSIILDAADSTRACRATDGSAHRCSASGG